MKNIHKQLLVVFLFVLALPVLVIGALTGTNFIPRAVTKPANLFIDTTTYIGPLTGNWRALAQGGEEQGVRMIADVVEPIRMLAPRYIRIDHIYDFYNVVEKMPDGGIGYHWNDLDATVCDILATGAKPFFSLGYMPIAFSSDRTPIGRPVNWQDWEVLVRATIEHYSAVQSFTCSEPVLATLDDVYYEVWNEPDLESFGAWSVYGGDRDYKALYYYASEGATHAENVRRFFLGGPATTRVYQNWMQIFLKYASAYDLRVDFLSWHQYNKSVNAFFDDAVKVDRWLSGKEFDQYRKLPRVISEWGFDSEENSANGSNLAAAHEVAVIRSLIDRPIELAFHFEIKDGIHSSWGILSREGALKPKYRALSLLNVLSGRRLWVNGEGTYVKAIASKNLDRISLVVVNYDVKNLHKETVPISFRGLTPNTKYSFRVLDMAQGDNTIVMQTNEAGILNRIEQMQPNSVIAYELSPFTAVSENL